MRSKRLSWLEGRDFRDLHGDLLRRGRRRGKSSRRGLERSGGLRLCSFGFFKVDSSFRFDSLLLVLVFGQQR